MKDYPAGLYTRFSVSVRDSVPRQVLTVSELTSLVRECVEHRFSDVWLEGEVSNLRAPGSGHVYCTLKDDASQIRAVIFRSTAARLRFALEDGLHLVARGRLTVYEPRGEYQVVLDYAEPKGLGALQLAFEQLKQRLSDEGLFAAERKRALPFLPRKVALITSLSGAAVQDMITVLHRRCPSLGIVILPVQVQGDGSGQQIAEAIREAGELEDVDVLIVGRGGGSLEDLWSFNDERVVRAIAASRVPVISAVGHETDVTLADFAADVRAPTPSAAAEAAVPVLSELDARIQELGARCRQALVWRCTDERRRLALLLAEVTRVRFRLLEAAQKVDGAVLQLTQSMQDRLSTNRDRVNTISFAVHAKSPRIQVRHGLAVVPQLMSRLHGVMRHGLQRRIQEVHACMDHLHHLSPLAILARGYSIVELLPSHVVVQEAQQLTVGDDLLARLARGQVRCTVNEVITDSSMQNGSATGYNQT